MTRIRAKYTKVSVPNTDLLGKIRYIEDGHLFETKDSSKSVNCGFVAVAPMGCWRNPVGDEVQEIIPVGRAAFVASQAKPEAAPESDQAFKADGGKPNWFLLMSAKGCAKALAGIVRVLSFAVAPVPTGKGYTEHSWRSVPNAKERYEAALYRHLNKIQLGEKLDDESGESHWYHVGCNALFLAELHNEGESK